MKKLLYGLILLGALCPGAVKEEIATKAWAAHWIDVPEAAPQDYGVYHFRRSFDLPVVPQHFVVYVSGDNRYQLLVNSVRVAWGPARGDLTHWRYETIDIAPQLRTGWNVLAAVVWNDGPYRAVAQISNQTAFLLQAAEPENAFVNTGPSWRCTVDKAYTPQPLPASEATGYYALAANEKVDARLYPWEWEQASFDDSSWTAAHELTRGAPRDARDAPNRWMLVPSEIPLEEQRPERLARVRLAEGIRLADEQAQKSFLDGHSPLTIPPNISARLLLDQDHLTTAYPELHVGGGQGAAVTLHYAEALYSRDASAKAWVKGNRDEVIGKQFLGSFDTFLPDGGSARIYRPLFWRTYRYLQLEIKTADQPLTIDDLHGTFTGYPFEARASFKVSDRATDGELQRILTTGWRTARLCAHETYMDCPYYEQLQYAGDARIQMLVSLYMTGDARLMKNGIALLNSSRTAEGATYSRAPSNLQQYIPPFSLWWIGMVHDYWMYVDDPEFSKAMLPGVRAVLSFYGQYQKENGSLRRMPWWNFVDWVKQWANGEPPAEPDGSSGAALDLQLLLAYRWAADLERGLGSKALADEYEQRARALDNTVQAIDWDGSAHLLADQPSHRTYSQQVNTLAVLAHVVPREEARALVEKMFDAHEPTLAQSSIYFRAYTNAALREVGLGDRYLDTLGPWREMLRDGLTTWAEWNGPDTRSDCHAWGASPNFELLRTVAGIDSLTPGFKRIRVAPNPGSLKEISARMPHPAGTITVHLHHHRALVADVDLPGGTDGEFEWAGAKHPLHAGENHLELK